MHDGGELLEVCMTEGAARGVHDGGGLLEVCMTEGGC